MITNERIVFHEYMIFDTAYEPFNRDAKYDIYIVREDGTDLRQITDTPNISERWPTWSPDGLSLAYAAMDYEAPSPNWDIYMVTSGGENASR